MILLFLFPIVTETDSKSLSVCTNSACRYSDTYIATPPPCCSLLMLANGFYNLQGKEDSHRRFFKTKFLLKL